MRLDSICLLVSLPLVNLIAERACAQSCPTDDVHLGRSAQPLASYSSSALDTSHVGCDPRDNRPPPNCFPNFVGHLSYNWPAGSFRADGYAYLQNGGSHVRAEDEFAVHGLAAPTTLTAVLSVEGAMSAEHHPEGSAYALVEASLSSDGGPPAQELAYVFGSPSTPVQFVLRSSFTVTPGQPFRVRLFFHTGAFVTWLAYSSSAQGVAVLTFEGLPGGSSIRSCKGFTQGVTRTTTRSWGQVKAMYR